MTTDNKNITVIPTDLIDVGHLFTGVTQSNIHRNSAYDSLLQGILVMNLLHLDVGRDPHQEMGIEC